MTSFGSDSSRAAYFGPGVCSFLFIVTCRCCKTLGCEAMAKEVESFRVTTSYLCNSAYIGEGS
jgi:hypothetical protein